MEDLTNWVTREAQNMGVDFSCLNPQTRNQIISILMSGLENGFRSRMDNADLRFGRNKGIIKSASYVKKDYSTTNPQTVSNTICPGTDQHCTQNAVNICDNRCSNSVTITCTDGSVHKCFDSICTNTTQCSDSNCEDFGCQNDNLCADTEISSAQTCLDLMCHNSTSCKGDGGKDQLCTNYINCADSKSCRDEGCVNAISPIGDRACADNIQSCFDEGCRNHLNCTDMVPCTDSPCEVFDSKYDPQCTDGLPNCGLNYGPDCTDGECTVVPMCIGTEIGETCSDGSCTYHHCSDSCADTGTSGCIDVNNACIDQATISTACLDSSFCTNNHTCEDKSVAASCVDNECINSDGQCTDEGSCTDTSCSNDICHDESNCGDSSCTNSICNDGNTSATCSDGACNNNKACEDDVNCCDSGDGCTNEACVDFCGGVVDSSCINKKCIST